MSLLKRRSSQTLRQISLPGTIKRHSLSDDCSDRITSPTLGLLAENLQERRDCVLQSLTVPKAIWVLICQYDHTWFQPRMYLSNISCMETESSDHDEMAYVTTDNRLNVYDRDDFVQEVFSEKVCFITYMTTCDLVITTDAGISYLYNPIMPKLSKWIVHHETILCQMKLDYNKIGFGTLGDFRISQITVEKETIREKFKLKQFEVPTTSCLWNRELLVIGSSNGLRFFSYRFDTWDAQRQRVGTLLQLPQPIHRVEEKTVTIGSKTQHRLTVLCTGMIRIWHNINEIITHQDSQGNPGIDSQCNCQCIPMEEMSIPRLITSDYLFVSTATSLLVLSWGSFIVQQELPVRAIKRMQVNNKHIFILTEGNELYTIS